MSTFTYRYSAKEFQEMYEARFKLIDGRISRSEMYKFLKELKDVDPPNIQNITQVTDENVADINNSFEPRVRNKIGEIKLGQGEVGSLTLMNTEAA